MFVVRGCESWEMCIWVGCWLRVSGELWGRKQARKRKKIDLVEGVDVVISLYARAGPSG
jgi:hypothetical protein